MEWAELKRICRNDGVYITLEHHFTHLKEEGTTAYMVIMSATTAMNTWMELSEDTCHVISEIRHKYKVDFTRKEDPDTLMMRKNGNCNMIRLSLTRKLAT